MSLVTLDAVKSAVRAADFTDDDALLQTLVDAAEASVSGHLRRDIAVEFAGGLPKDIAQAVTLLVAFWYDPKNDASGDWPQGVSRLLAPYRSFS